MGSIGNVSGGNLTSTIQSYGGFRGFINNFPYSNTSNPVDDRLESSLKNVATSFDSNISPYYVREENVISVGITGERNDYDLSTKAGNEFKKIIKSQIESTGLEVEAMGKRKVDGSPEFWFRVKTR